MRAILAGSSVDHVAVTGDRWREVRRLVAEREIDLLVVHRSDAVGRVLWRTFPAALDKLSCPVVCLPASGPSRPGTRRARLPFAAAPRLDAQGGAPLPGTMGLVGANA